ncbi:cyclic lactone autoinducer peptide [Inediibacterium massiliense]|nr:cyclic lactone autoinducer peptide [Inediibacterium massiliense]
MKKVVKFVEKNSLHLLSMCALFVGATAASAATMWYSHQVKCPEELLK